MVRGRERVKRNEEIKKGKSSKYWRIEKEEKIKKGRKENRKKRKV